MSNVEATGQKDRIFSSPILGGATLAREQGTPSLTNYAAIGVLICEDMVIARERLVCHY